ncbi:MAG: hypothetical protein AB7U82_11600 [Blastocatellales bacterium]
MRFTYSVLKQHASRAGRYALSALIVSLIALGVLLTGGGAVQKDSFKMADATTTEDNGKRVRAKAGFKLVAKDKTTIVARRVSKNTTSGDRVKCTCSPPPSSGGFVCNFRLEDDGTAICGTSGSACCRWVPIS